MGRLPASWNTWATFLVVKACTTVPVTGPTSAVASLTSLPMILLISRRSEPDELANNCRCNSWTGAAQFQELPLQLLELGGLGRRPGEGLLRRRQGLVQRDDQRALAHDHGHGLRLVVARPAPVEGNCHPGDLWAMDA